MSEQKKKKFQPFAFFKRKQFRFGGYAILATLLVIAVVILVNVGVKAVEDNWALRLDLSYNSLTKFSEQTATVLKELDQDIHFYVLAPTGNEDPKTMEILDRYRAGNKHITVQTIDPDKNPAVVNRFKEVGTSLSSNSVVIANADETRYKVCSYYDLVEYAYDQQRSTPYVKSFHFEEMFTQGILYVTAEKTPTVYVLQGHGEVDMANLAAMQSLLQSNNYDVKQLGIGDEMPDSKANILFVLSPAKDLAEEERTKIMGFLENGGSMFYVRDVTAPDDLPNFNSLLSYYGVGYQNGMVIANLNDTKQFYPMKPQYLLPQLGTHDITTPLTEGKKNMIIAPQTRAIALPEMDRNDFTVTPLLSSSTGSYLVDVNDSTRTTIERQSGDTEGPFTLAAAVQHLDFIDESKESRIVLAGSSLMIAQETMLNSFNNAEFLLSAVKWATKDEAINLGIMSKTAQRASLQITSASEFYTLAVLVIFVLPLIILVAGIVVFLKRRHL